MRHIEQRSIASVSTYDQTNGALISLIIIVGFLVMVLFVIWCTLQFRVTRVQPKPIIQGTFYKVSLNESPLETADSPMAAAPEFKDVIALVKDAVSSIRANDFNKSSFESTDDSDGTREVGSGRSGGGDPNFAVDPRPEHSRWAIRYENLSFAQYKQVLSQFGIEIGVVHLNDNQILRVRLDGEFAQVKTSDRAAERNNIYFQNALSVSKRWDQQIVRSLNVDVNGSAIVHFFPADVIDRLRSLESERIGVEERKVADVVETQFKIVQSEGRCEFVVHAIKFL